MPKHLPAYDEVTRALAPVMAGLPPRLIAIAGPMLAGKSTLSRFLAWHFNVTLIETDPFLTQGAPHFQYRAEEIRTLINFRQTLRRPVIVEGVAVLQLLTGLSLVPDFVVNVQRRLDAVGHVASSPLSLTITLDHPEDK